MFNKSLFIGMFLGVVFTLIFLVGGFVVLYRMAIAKYPDTLEAPVMPTADATYEWTLQDLAGETFEFASLKGSVVFLAVWSPTCEHCKAELPYLQELYEKIEGEDIAFATVAVGEEDLTIDLVAEMGLTFPVYTSVGERPAAYSGTGVPATYILSPEGKIAYRHVGPARWDDDQCVAFLRSLALGNQKTQEATATDRDAA